MGRNIFDLEKIGANMDREWEAGRKPSPAKISGDYEIEATGQEGWLAYRYQYKVGSHDFYGYAESVEEARSIIIEAQAKEAGE